ncbi:hypothetical protein [uncultured Porphyromonas sp.]|uniref:hypothetical protein n=1 Tax=uncultured Porphyromonas sp. TaxID=159274 RepID=UPI0026363804|nr:hypothetical protein [uncultured Porphyromonas sp.]
MVKIITASCLVLLLGACYLSPGWVSYLLLVPMLLPLIYLPRGYELQEDRIVLHCLLWRKTFLLADYEVRAPEQEPLLGGIRLFASGGYLGFTGFFWLPKRGCCSLFVADQRGPFLELTHRTMHRRYIINGSLAA